MNQPQKWMTLAVLCCAAATAASEDSLEARLQTARTACERATKLQEVGKYADAISQAESSLKLWRELQRETHPEAARCLELLGYLHLLQGHPARAELLLQHALSTLEAGLGRTHPDVATAIDHLASTYKVQGINDRAEELYQRAFAIRAASLDKNHPDIAASLNNLANFYTDQGLYARAEPLYRRALAIVEPAFGGNHPLVAGILNNLATLYVDQGRYAQAEPLLERALALREKSLGGNHPDVAASLTNLANLYTNQGQYARAEPLYDRSLEILEAALGSKHPDVARTLDNLARLYVARGAYGRARALLGRSLTITEEALGQDHPDVATALDSLAGLDMSQGLYARAQPLLERALALREAALGTNHPFVAASLSSLAHLYMAQGLYGRAGPLFQRALAIEESALGANHPLIADALSNLAHLYMVQGLYEQAGPLYQRALAIDEAALGPKHPDVADSLDSLASLYDAQGLYAQAEPLYQRALTIRETTLGTNHPEVATSLNFLGHLYTNQGLYTRAEPLYQRALALREAALGSNHPDVATSLNSLARLHARQGAYDQAEPLYLRALSIRQAVLGEKHPDVARTLNNLANLYADQGLYAQAEPLYQRALAIRRAVLGNNHPDVATSLNNLANLYVDQGLYERAEPLYERALAMGETLFGGNHPDVARTLNNLARLYTSQGLYDRAGSLLERALAIREELLGANHPDIAYSLDNLAGFYMAQGQYDRAEPLIDRALVIWKASLGAAHPRVASSLNALAELRLAQRRLPEALPLLTRAFELSEGRLRREALDFSEERLASFLQFLRANEERLYALVREHPEDSRVRNLTLAATLLLKGRSSEETASTSHAIYQSLSARDRETFEQLRVLRTQLAELSLQGPSGQDSATYQKRLKKLAAEGDALEASLARRSAPLRALTALPSLSTIASRVAESLPKDGALIELVAYEDRPLLPNPGKKLTRKSAQLRYLALVLFPDASTRALDLGPADPIDRAATQLRDALARRDAEYQAPAQALYQLAFEPLLPLLSGTRRLFLAPDGQLNLIPFAALHDGHQFLVESFDFTYLTSGRDLLPRPRGKAPSRGVAVFADPAFQSPPVVSAASSKGEATVAERSTTTGHFFATLRARLGNEPWSPLPGTRQEAEAIQRLVPQARLFLGSEATKARLLSLPTPGVLHLATHGFFLKDTQAPESSRAVGSFGAMGASDAHQLPQDPLLRSGLVLVGSQDTSLVTALELAGLDLWGTELVVLSACDTGRGDIKLGQGVYGLRRALTVAGAETIVMSLWKVNDDTTSQLMEDYYRHLLAGQGRGTALREAMRSLRRTHPHPHYWAPFIALGRDAPLALIHATPTR
jgi:tetratricopeptide (TPR) repeat protein/CHAT domain-containing protein